MLYKQSIFLILFLSSNWAMSQGIRFFETESFSAILTMSKESKKIVFIDAFTTWCGPCKQMDRDVFADSVIAKKYHMQFINNKVDAEKGDGVELSKKYSIDAYPTFLFLDERGNTLYKHIGIATKNEMLKLADHALAERNDSKTFGVWESEFFEKKNDSIFMYEYLTKRNKLQMSSAAEFDLYFNLLSNHQRIDQKNIALIIENEKYFPSTSTSFDFILKNYKVLSGKFNGEFSSKLDNWIEQNLRRYFHIVVKSNSEEELNEFLRVNQYVPQDGSLFRNNSDCQEIFYRVNKNFEKYQSIVIPKLDSLFLSIRDTDVSTEHRDIDAHSLTIATEYILNNTEDERLLKKTKLWMECAVDLQPTLYPTFFLTHYVYGKLLSKLKIGDLAALQLEEALRLVPKDDFFFKEIESHYTQAKQ